MIKKNNSNLDQYPTTALDRGTEEIKISPMKKRRLELGLTLPKLSITTGYSPSYLYRLENKARRLNDNSLKVIAKALECSQAYLLGESLHISHELGHADYSKRKGKKQSLDIPVYSLKSSIIDGETIVHLNDKDVVNSMERPSILLGFANSMAVRTYGSFHDVFGHDAIIFVSKSVAINPEDLVLVVKEDVARLFRIWSVTPNAIQLCDPAHIGLLKQKDINAKEIRDYVKAKIIEEEKDKLVIYSVKGYIALNESER